MGRENFWQVQFRKKIRLEREGRGWSQAQVSQSLKSKGIDNMHSTTVAKIESGEREVKLDEAAAIADLFEMSLDALVARGSTKRRDDEFTFYLRRLRDNARQRAGQVADLSWSITGDLGDVGLDGVPDDVANLWQQIQDRAASATHDLDAVAQDLSDMAEDATEILSRRQRKDIQ